MHGDENTDDVVAGIGICSEVTLEKMCFESLSESRCVCVHVCVCVCVRERERECAGTCSGHIQG